MPEQLILKSDLPPGDIMTMTAAVKALHDLFPGKYVTCVQTQYPEIWENNPHITPLEKGRLIELEYPTIHTASERSIMFLQGYTYNLENQLNLRLKLTTNKPDIYFTDEEKEKPPFSHLPARYIVFNAGVKKDYTAKQWPVEYFEEVVKHFDGRIMFVQVGRSRDRHVPIKGTINMIDGTTLRQLLCLCLHSTAGLCPVTFLQHAMAAAHKPCVTLLGGRENMPWAASYPLQTTLHRIGSTLPCCKQKACWKARVVPLHDGLRIVKANLSLDQSMCELPVTHTKVPVAKCMHAIKPEEVIQIIETYL